MDRGYRLGSGELIPWIEDQEIWEHTTLYRLLGRIYKRGRENEKVSGPDSGSDCLDCPSGGGRNIAPSNGTTREG